MLRTMLGGVGGGMITFLELANMVDATQDGVGWGGWGGGGMITGGGGGGG